MIYVGIDDTDTLDTRGTNKLALALAESVRSEFVCRRITRHQLLDDPRVPYTSKNGSASLVFEPRGNVGIAWLAEKLIEGMRADFIPGSDPGFCIAQQVPESIERFGRRCQRELIAQEDARALARSESIQLLGLGGTEDGVIGALAAIGLAVGNDDGRVIHCSEWSGEASGLQSVESLAQQRVLVRDADTGATIEHGFVELGKKLRPNWHGGRCVVYARPVYDTLGRRDLYQAVKVP